MGGNMNYNNKHIVSDLDSMDLQDFNITSKNINTKIDVSLQARREALKQKLLTALKEYNIDKKVLREINNPKNFEIYANLVTVKNTEQLKQLLSDGILVL